MCQLSNKMQDFYIMFAVYPWKSCVSLETRKGTSFLKRTHLANLYTLLTTRLVEQLFYFNLALKSLALKSWLRHIPGNALDFWYASGTALMVAKPFKSLLILWPSLFYRLSSWDVVYLNTSLHFCKFSKGRFKGVCGCQKILTFKLIFHSKYDKIYTLPTSYHINISKV